MRISSTIVLTGVLAASCGWLVRGIASEPHDASPMPAMQSSRPAPAVTTDEPLRVSMPESVAATTRGARNLFAYVEPPVTAKAIAPVALPPPMAAPQSAAIDPVPVAKPKPKFTHRFIGSFGPAHRPIAAFVRDGEVVTARVGDRVDRFVIRAIGMESVEVQTDVDGALHTERVPLTSSL